MHITLTLQEGVRSPAHPTRLEVLWSGTLQLRRCFASVLIGARSSVDPLLRYTQKAVKKDEIDFDFLTVPLARERL